jgi:hypothetical protein
LPLGNSASMTGPMIWTILPTLVSVVATIVYVYSGF